jgi:hypothetical protein
MEAPRQINDGGASDDEIQAEASDRDEKVEPSRRQGRNNREEHRLRLRCSASVDADVDAEDEARAEARRELAPGKQASKRETGHENDAQK